MKKLFRRALIITFSLMIVAGIIGIVIPFEFENFYYNSIYSGTCLEINNSSNKTYENIIATVEYTLYAKNGTGQATQAVISIAELAKNSKTQQRIDVPDTYRSARVTSVKLTTSDGKTFNIYTNPFFAGINWAFICLIVVGFFGIAVVFAINKSRQKEEEEEIRNKKTFQDRIREAFTPVADSIYTVKKTFEDSARRNGEEKPRKVTCHYCKGKYSSTENKCPHCGAPPEPYN